MTITVRHYAGIMNTPALPLAVRAWHELLASGHTDHSAIVVQYDHKAIVVFSDDEPVGVLTYYDQDWSSQLGVAVAFVLPAHRRQGIHARMWHALVERAQELKRTGIVSGSHISNAVSRAIQSKRGSIESHVNTRFEVPTAVVNVTQDEHLKIDIPHEWTSRMCSKCGKLESRSPDMPVGLFCMPCSGYGPPSEGNTDE